MGFLDRLVNGGFKTTEDGRKLFFPHGNLGRGYIIPSEVEFQGLQKWIRAFIIWQICLFVIFFLLIHYVSAQIGVIFFLLIVILDHIWAYPKYRQLERADEKFVFNESLTKRVRKIESRFLWLFEIGAIALVTLGIFLTIVYWRYDLILMSSIGLIIIFSHWATFIAQQIMANRRIKVLEK